MAKLQLPHGFKEFLKLLSSNNVDYLLIGGYAVNIHGYVRMTNGLDIWVRPAPDRMSHAQRAFVIAGA